MASALADLRYGFRQLRLNPGFAAVAILTLALGIGANTALFTVVRGIILKPLPYPEPERIVRVWMDNRILQMREDWTSWLNYQDYKRLSTSFESWAGFTQPMVNLIGDGEPERIRGMFTEASVFRVLGAQAGRGPSLHAGRGSRRAASGRGDRVGAVAAAVRRRAGARQAAGFRRHALHRDRRHAARLRVSDEGYRVLGAAAGPRKREVARRLLAADGRAAEAGRHARTGPERNGRRRQADRNDVSGRSEGHGRLRQSAGAARRGHVQDAAVRCCSARSASCC